MRWLLLLLAACSASQITEHSDVRHLQPTYTATYEWRDEYTGEEAVMFAVYADGAVRRVDSGAYRQYVTPDQIYDCFNNGSWHCRSSAHHEEEPAGTRTADREVGGIRALCYSDKFQESCYSPEGVPVYYRLPTPEGDIIQELVAYSPGVPDGVFELPVSPAQGSPTSS